MPLYKKIKAGFIAKIESIRSRKQATEKTASISVSSNVYTYTP